MSFITRAPSLIVQPMVEFASPLYQLAQTSLTPADALRVSNHWIQLATRVALAVGASFVKQKVAQFVNARTSPFIDNWLSRWIYRPGDLPKNASAEEKSLNPLRTAVYTVSLIAPLFVLNYIMDRIIGKFDVEVVRLTNYMVPAYTTIKSIWEDDIQSTLKNGFTTAYNVDAFNKCIPAPGHLTGRIQTLGSTFAPQLARLFGYQL